MDAPTLTGYKVTFAGLVTKTTAAGAIAFNSFTGATIQIKATQPAAKDLLYKGVFLLTTQQNFTPLIGTDLAKDQGAIFTIDIKGGKVTISTAA